MTAIQAAESAFRAIECDTLGRQWRIRNEFSVTATGLLRSISLGRRHTPGTV